MNSVASAFEAIASRRDLVEQFHVSNGDDQGPYFNFRFDTSQPLELWREIKANLYNSRELGLHMRRASMATCTGKRGWDDYLFLFHFDPAIEIDVEANI